MTEAPAAAPPSPYKGLAAFGESDLDALFFFGRERETAVIAANVIAARFTVLYGPLGVGKSSVLRAGVVRRLRALAPDAAVVAYDSWAGDAAGGLLAAVSAALGMERPPAGTPLADGLGDLAGRSAGDLYLLLDQFEELFVYPGAEELATELAAVVTRPGSRIDVLVALREDALAELDVFTGRLPNVFGNYLPLDRLDREAARAAITEPLARYNELSAGPPVELEDELVEAVLDQVEVGRLRAGGANGRPAPGPGAGAVEAPYLQLVLERLWDAEQRRGSTVLRRETLDDLGGAQAIVQAHLGEAVAALGAGERDLAARVFNHLVTPSGTKIAHRAEDLAEYADVREEELRPVLASLGNSRILRPVDGRFEIYHDVLADAVLAWRTRHESERALERQRVAAERRQRRLLALLVASLVILAAMAAVTVYAVTQRAEARDQADAAEAAARSAQANRLAADAAVLIPSAQAELDHELALALAAEATRLAPTVRAVNSLRRALLVSHLRAVVPEEGVTAASFGPDGGSVAVATEEGTIALYADDARTPLGELSLDDAATGVAFGPGGGELLTTERGGPARTWDAETGAELGSFGEAPAAASFSPDGSLVLTVEPGGARVWSAADGSLVAAPDQPDSVREASFSPDGGLVVTVGEDGLARVFDARSGEPVTAVRHGDVTTTAVLTPGGELLVTTGGDSVARVWSVEDGRLRHELEGHRAPLTGAVVAGDGGLVVTTSEDGTARSWDLSTGAFVAELAGLTGSADGAAFSADSETVATWGVGPTVRIGPPGSSTAQAILAGHDEGVASASFHPSGDLVVTTGVDGRARLWRTGVEAELEPLATVPGPVSAAVFSGDGSTAALAGPDGVEVLRTADGSRAGQADAPDVSVLAIAHDGSLVAGAGGGRISVWRAGEGEPLLVADAPATALAVGPDALAAGAADGSIAVRSLDGQVIHELSGDGRRVTALGLDPSGSRLAAGFGDGTLAAWSLGDGSLLYRRREHRPRTPVTSVAFSADGARLVSAGGDTTARVWEAATGRVLYTLRGHSRAVRSAAFSPGGDWVATTAAFTAGLWDASTRQRLLLLSAGGGRPLAASFDPTGDAVLVAEAGGSVSRYSCAICGGVDELLALADERLAATGRQLTAEERRHYLEER